MPHRQEERAFGILRLMRLLPALLLLVCATGADARSSGIYGNCDGCHRTNNVPSLELTASPASPSPGQTVRLTLRVQAANGPEAGMYLSANAGSFKMVSGQPTRTPTHDPTQVTHSSPKTASGGDVTFLVDWVAPAAPGGVDFYAEALSANGDNGSGGDGAAATFLTLTYGCAGNVYYRDLDGDGFGSEASGYTKNCAQPAGYSSKAGDCNDNDERVYPGKVEECNGRDDNCVDGIDEGLDARKYYQDNDGDGFGAGDYVVGCGVSLGVEKGGDCDDTHPAVSPDATEVCNNRDDDCDGRIDENVRATCGEGWCRRYAPSCDSPVCTPGEPQPEVCNYLDDDCDGMVDEGSDATLCPKGGTCLEGRCVGGPSNPDAGTGASPDGGPVSEPGVEPLPATSGCQSVPGLMAFLGVLLLLPLRRRSSTRV